MFSTWALKPTSSPSFTFVFSHFTFVIFFSFPFSSRLCSYSFSLSGCIIVGIGIIFPGPIILLLSFTPMSLHVVTVLPTNAASLPFIFNFFAVPPVTSPLLSGIFINRIVPGSCMCNGLLCLAMLPLYATACSAITTLGDMFCCSLPINGCGSGTTAVLNPAGISIWCMSKPITLNPSCAIRLPSLVTFIPLSSMRCPCTCILLSQFIYTLFSLSFSNCPWLSMLTFSA